MLVLVVGEEVEEEEEEQAAASLLASEATVSHAVQDPGQFLTHRLNVRGGLCGLEINVFKLPLSGLHTEMNRTPEDMIRYLFQLYKSLRLVFRQVDKLHPLFLFKLFINGVKWSG